MSKINQTLARIYQNLKSMQLKTATKENMSDRDRVLFDLKGYIIKPAVLTASEIKSIKEFTLRQKEDPESLPPHQRHLPGGPFARLIDHPQVMSVLLNVIDPDLAKIRLENIFLSQRQQGEGEWRPHAGGRTTNPNYAYNFYDGQNLCRDDASGLGIE